MKITREIIDNGMKIIHVKYEDKDIKKIKEKQIVNNENTSLKKNHIINGYCSYIC